VIASSSINGALLVLIRILFLSGLFVGAHALASGPEKLSSGGWHSCLIKNDTLDCWGGENTLFYFQQNDVPHDISHPVQISAGLHHTCAIDDVGLRCWGYENVIGATACPSVVPAEMVDSYLVTAGYNFTCAASKTAKQRIKCWGENGDGQLTVPKAVQNLMPEKIQSGFAHTCVLAEKKMSCWGWNSSGQLNVPANIGPIDDIAVGSSHSCALSGGKVRCWGWNKYGQVEVPPIDDVKEISAGIGFSCALTDRNVICWGDNTFGQLMVSGTLRNPRQLSCGAEFACVLTDDGVKCWGDNALEQTMIPWEISSLF
jgi:alpha-tubulin suppressor-like RCC1 family protein